MKKLIFALAVTTALGASAAMKFGTVEMLTLVRNHPNYDSNKTLLTTTEKDYKKKLDVIKGDLDKIQEEGKKLAEQARNPMLSANAKQKLEKDMMEVQGKYLAAQQRLRQEMGRSQQDLQDLEARLLRTTSDDIRKRVKKYAEEKGYDVIADSSAMVFSKKEFDVTPAILKAMGVDPATARGKEDESK